MALVEAWMSRGACQDLPALPWLAERDAVAPSDHLDMLITCRGCPVHDRCTAFVDRERITGGFWAGHFREPMSEPAVQAPQPAPDLGGAA